MSLPAAPACALSPQLPISLDIRLNSYYAHFMLPTDAALDIPAVRLGLSSHFRGYIR
jgi:hypothetical protein